MLDNKQIQQIKNITVEFFEKMGVQGEFKIEQKDDGSARISAGIEDPAIFIGQSGQVLGAIQHLLKIILRRAMLDVPMIELDINDYKKNKIAYLKELAREAADEVAITKQPKELAPMPAYERRIVHLELSGRSDIATESVGDGLGRRVTVKPL